ncbi:ANR family transcriptional regulator [Enterobacter mori]|uniref:ANR family transcriptional regulator n=1 Tax=Enterobacter mori TaxID=539813 RepID=UPI003B8413FD
MSNASYERFQVRDYLAEKLEKQGLWRRAATRWLAVLDSAVTEADREGAMHRRNYCLRMAEKPITFTETTE